MSWRFNPFTGQLDRVECPPVFVYIDHTDSPYLAVRPAGGKTVIIVDDSVANVVIDLYAKVEKDEITIKKKGTVSFKTTYNGNGDDTIDGDSTRDILAQYSADRLVGEAGEWGRH